MSNALTTMGLVCLLAAIVGGGLKAAGFEIPPLRSGRRQALLAIFGLVLLVIGNFDRFTHPPVTYHFEAHSNGVPTFTKCISPSQGYHFRNWKIDKTVTGDGDAWFTTQGEKQLCVRADASRTAGGGNSGVDAKMIAEEVRD